VNPVLQALLDARIAETGEDPRTALLSLIAGETIATGDGVTVTAEADGVTATDDADEEVPPPEPSQAFPGFIRSTTPGQRDTDTYVGNVCPACARGGPRAGALHDCGRSNDGIDPTPRATGPNPAAARG
jgi:hypothetical protein